MNDSQNNQSTEDETQECCPRCQELQEENQILIEELADQERQILWRNKHGMTYSPNSFRSPGNAYSGLPGDDLTF